MTDNNSGYGGYVTDAGRNLLMKLQAGDTMRISRVMVGDGVVPNGVNPETLTDLVNPLCTASSTSPVVKNSTLYITVVYENNKEYSLTTDFVLTEFGVFAIDSSNKEVLVYYATLADYPELVTAYDQNKPNVVIRRYPISVALTSTDINVTLDFDSGLVTELAEKRTIDGVEFNGASNIHHQTRSGAAADIAEKTTDEIDGFVLDKGARVSVLFDSANTAENPALAVSGSAAAPIRYGGQAVIPEMISNIAHSFEFDGVYWQLLNPAVVDGDGSAFEYMTYYGAQYAWKIFMIHLNDQNAYQAFMGV